MFHLSLTRRPKFFGIGVLHSHLCETATILSNRVMTSEKISPEQGNSHQNNLD